MTHKVRWPEGKRAAFTIIDDTDDAELPNIREIYNVLHQTGLRTTKTVWVYPPKDPEFVRGDSLTTSDAYLDFIKQIVAQGFEVGLHNVGSGGFTRHETMAGIEEFKRLLGFSPSIHVNHSYNKENIYSGNERFSWPLSLLVEKIYSGYSGFEGNLPQSAYFWGDIHKKLISWSRSLEVDRMNLLAVVPVPYSEPRFNEYANAFFPSVFCPNQDLFRRKVTKSNLDSLVNDGGLSIIYTHFGYFHERGSMDEGFLESMRTLKEFQDDIWFAPVGEILAFLEKTHGVQEIGDLQRLRLEIECLYTRVKYRYFVRLDDYHYKRSLGFRHRAETRSGDDSLE